MRIFSWSSLLAAFAVVWSVDAFAYIDPATGSMLVQGLIAFFVGAAFTIKTFWYSRIKPLFRRLLGQPAQDDSSGSSDKKPPT